MHVSQLATLLGLPAPETPAVARLGYDILLVVESWAVIVAALPAELLTAPTESRGRSIRNLTMNAIHPIGLLAEARATGRFPWGMQGEEADEQLGLPYETVAALAGFVRAVAGAWAAFLLELEDDADAADAEVETPRGRVRFADLLAAQRWHVAFHHRQVVEFLDAAGAGPADAFRVEQLGGLTLPESVV